MLRRSYSVLSDCCGGSFPPRRALKKNPYPVGRSFSLNGTPKGIRTPVAAVRGRCPRPLDHGGRLAAELGFEPRRNGSEPFVLPLHYSATFGAKVILSRVPKAVNLFLRLAKHVPLYYNQKAKQAMNGYRFAGKAQPDIWRSIEAVITGLTRNQVDGNVSWVRIPPSPPKDRVPSFEGTLSFGKQMRARIHPLESKRTQNDLQSKENGGERGTAQASYAQAYITFESHLLRQENPRNQAVPRVFLFPIEASIP